MVGEVTEIRQVEAGSSNDQYTEIVSGLNPGDTVVIRGTSTAQPRTNFGVGTVPGGVVPGGGGGMGGQPGGVRIVR